jgi:hypothetical protein
LTTAVKDHKNDFSKFRIKSTITSRQHDFQDFPLFGRSSCVFWLRPCAPGCIAEVKDDGALIPRRIKALYNPVEVSKSKNHDYFLKK